MKTVSKQEARLLQFLNQNNQTYFTISQALKAYQKISKNNLEKLLSNMKYKGLIERIKGGTYYIIPYEQNPKYFIPDWHSLVPHITQDRNYYIGYYTALNIHQLNTQPSLKEQVVVDQQIKPASITIKDIAFQFIYHNNKHFFGYEKTWINDFQQENCSNIEKTIIDCLFKPHYAGGITEIAKAIYLAKEKIDMEKLLTYTQKFQSQAVIKRLGFLLEILPIDNNHISKELKKIKYPSITPLDPTLPSTGKINTKWSIQQNIDTYVIQSSIYT